MGTGVQIVYITNGCGKVQHLEGINVDMMGTKMRAIKQNDIIDVIYDSWYDLPLEEADKVVCDYVNKKLIPIEWIGKWWDKQPPKRDSVFFLLRDWERETGIDAEQHAQVIEEMRSRRAGEKEND